MRHLISGTSFREAGSFGIRRSPIAKKPVGQLILEREPTKVIELGLAKTLSTFFASVQYLFTAGGLRLGYK